MAIWHVAPLRFAPAFRALGVCEHIWLRYDPSCFDPIQKFDMPTWGLTLIFDPVPSTYFRPPRCVIYVSLIVVVWFRWMLIKSKPPASCVFPHNSVRFTMADLAGPWNQKETQEDRKTRDPTPNARENPYSQTSEDVQKLQQGKSTVLCHLIQE